MYSLSEAGTSRFWYVKKNTFELMIPGQKWVTNHTKLETGSDNKLRKQKFFIFNVELNMIFVRKH